MNFALTPTSLPTRSASPDQEQHLPAKLRDRRDALELQLFGLRDRRAELTDGDYQQRLEEILVELATLDERADGP